MRAPERSAARIAPLSPPRAVGHVNAHAGGAQPGGQHGQPQLGLIAQRDAEDVAARRRAHALALGAQRQQGTVHAEPKSDAGQVLSAELTHQPVVAATAADAGLGAETVVHELERGLGVVVEPAHHARVDHVGHPERVQVRQHGVEVLFGRIGEVIEQHRRVGRHRPHLGPFVVEDAQWIQPSAPPGFFVEVETEQEVLQQFPVLRTAAVVAQRGDLQAEPVQPQRAEPGVGDGDHLGVQRRVVHPDRLHTDLLQLAVATRLGALVAEKRSRITQFHRQRAPVQAVLDHRAHHSGRTLGPQRHRAVAAVGEGVHLLGHHVGGFADAAGEQRGVLEDGQLDVAVPGAAGGVQ